MPDLERLERLGEERRAVLASLLRATMLVRGEAVARYVGGAAKVDICRAAGVSRPTLDAWLHEEDSR